MGIRKIATAEDLASLLHDKNCNLMDIRPVAAYIGWVLNGEPRGGHIRGARSFPLTWTRNEEWPDLLKNKGIIPDKQVIVYGYGTGESEKMANKLDTIGYENIYTFDLFSEWSENDRLPMDRLARFRQLVYPQWLRDLISGKNPGGYDNDRYIICHASYRYREDYESGHIPGAIHLDTEWIESSKDWNRRSPDELRQAFLKLGIDRDTTVILYGRFSHPNNEDEYPGRMAGQLAAMRCAQILIYAGVKDVKILNGGMAAWNEAGHEITTEEGEIHPVDDFKGKIPENPQLIIDTPQAKELLASENGELVSIRSWDEFIANVSGYNYIDKAGRIPGAVFGNCGSDAYHMENYRNFDHTMREYHEIADIWKADGIIPEKSIAFYCGTGWRASEAFFHAYFMGWPKIAVYDGGWLEWSSDPDNPVETSLPKNQNPAWLK